MNQKQLTQAISEGITDSRNELSRQIMWGLITIFGIIVVFFTVLLMIDYDSPYTQYAQARPEKCNYPYVECKIYETEKYFKGQDNMIYESVKFNDTPTYTPTSVYPDFNSSLPLVDISDQIPNARATLCGYTEANSWYEQYRNNYQENRSRLKMECHQ